MVRAGRNAEARGDRDLLSTDGEWIFEDPQYLLSDAHTALDVDAGEEDGELVAAQSCDRVRGADCRVEAKRDLLEKLVTALMAERVVHVLEAVEIHHEQRQSTLPSLVSEDDLLE